MRFVWAVLAFVLATVLIGAAFAQRTFVGPNSEQQELKVESPAPFTLIDGAVLRAHEGAQTLLVRGDGEIFAAYGRTSDMHAWLAQANYNEFIVDENGELAVRLVAAEIAPPTQMPEEPGEEPTAEPTPEPSEEPTPEAEPALPADDPRNPAGSDLWLDEFIERDAVNMDKLQLPEGVSVLIARDGVQDAPTDIIVRWPRDNATPWAGPMIVAGTLLLALGVLLYIHAYRFQKRGRGPRRKGSGPLPPTEPIGKVIDLVPIAGILEPAEHAQEQDEPIDAEPIDEPVDAEPIEDPAPTRRSRRHARLAIPALGLSVVLLAGCSADLWPQFPAEPEPIETTEIIAPENPQTPAVTEPQAKRILLHIAETVAKADADLDAELLEARMSGAPLAERRTDYLLRAKIEGREPPVGIPVGKIRVLLPQAQDSWPRTVLLVAERSDEDTVAPLIMTLVQDDPWQDYRVTHIAEMQPATELPKLPPAWLGSQLIPPDSPFLAMAPGELAAAFADVVDKGDASEFYGLFDEATIALVTQVQESRQTVVQALIDHGASRTSKVAFAMREGDHPTVAMGTLESGAIVAIDVIDTEKVTPTNSLAVIRFADNQEAKALTGVTEASKGVESAYSMQLFFAVPSTGSNEPIRLLAVHQKLLSVEVIK